MIVYAFVNIECDLDLNLMFYKQIHIQIFFLLLTNCIDVSIFTLIAT